MLARDSFGVPAQKLHGRSAVLLLPHKLDSWCLPLPAGAERQKVTVCHHKALTPASSIPFGFPWHNPHMEPATFQPNLQFRLSFSFSLASLGPLFLTTSVFSYFKNYCVSLWLFFSSWTMKKFPSLSSKAQFFNFLEVLLLSTKLFPGYCGNFQTWAPQLNSSLQMRLAWDCQIE